MFIHFLTFRFKYQCCNKCKNYCTEIPALVTSKIPVRTPTIPSRFASAKAPFTKEFPKLLIGTDAPAPANFIKGSYNPNPPSIAPITTNVLCSMSRSKL